MRCPACGARASREYLAHVAHSPDCPAALAVLDGFAEDVAALASGSQRVVRAPRGSEFDELALAVGVHVPARERDRWLVALSPMIFGHRFRAFLRDGETVAAVADPPLSTGVAS